MTLLRIRTNNKKKLVFKNYPKAIYTEYKNLNKKEITYLSSTIFLDPINTINFKRAIRVYLSIILVKKLMIVLIIASYSILTVRKC